MSRAGMEFDPLANLRTSKGRYVRDPLSKSAVFTREFSDTFIVRAD